MQLLRFSMVGLAATAVHLVMVLFINGFFDVALVAVHSIGYLAAFIVSFSGHYIYTFKSKKQWHSALFRFLVVSVAAFFASLAVAWVGSVVGLSRMMSLLVAASSVPLLAYFAHREITF